MCTLSFLPQPEGYLIGMNRDELRSRALAAPPSFHNHNGLQALYPAEATGGTWIASNAAGISLALLNRNSADASQLGSKLRSRGDIIPTLISGDTFEAVDRLLAAMSLDGFHPFRLVGIFPSERFVREWKWNGKALVDYDDSWTRKHWFSSSRSDARAAAYRSRAFENSSHDSDAGATRLRSIHASHIPEAGAFSVCVHREDARTVSYTEVLCGSSSLEMSYLAGNPCEHSGDLFRTNLSLDVLRYNSAPDGQRLSARR